MSSSKAPTPYQFKPSRKDTVDHIKVSLPGAQSIKVSKLGLVGGAREYDRDSVALIFRPRDKDNLCAEVAPQLFGITTTAYLDMPPNAAFFIGTTFPNEISPDGDVILVPMDDVLLWRTDAEFKKPMGRSSDNFKKMWHDTASVLTDKDGTVSYVIADDAPLSILRDAAIRIILEHGQEVPPSSSSGDGFIPVAADDEVDAEFDAVIEAVDKMAAEEAAAAADAARRRLSSATCAAAIAAVLARAGAGQGGRAAAVPPPPHARRPSRAAAKTPLAQKPAEAPARTSKRTEHPAASASAPAELPILPPPKKRLRGQQLQPTPPQSTPPPRRQPASLPPRGPPPPPPPSRAHPTTPPPAESPDAPPPDANNRQLGQWVKIFHDGLKEAMGEGEEGKIMAAKEALEKAMKTPNYAPVYRTREEYKKTLEAARTLLNPAGPGPLKKTPASPAAHTPAADAPPATPAPADAPAPAAAPSQPEMLQMFVQMQQQMQQMQQQMQQSWPQQPPRAQPQQPQQAQQPPPRPQQAQQWS